MKHAAFHRSPALGRRRTPRQRGFIMLALLVIVTLMLFYVAASSRTLYQLHREITALDRLQVKRLTNSPPAAAIPQPQKP